jgi:hypothetical protein
VLVFDDDASAAAGDTHTRTQKYSVTHTFTQNDPAHTLLYCMSVFTSTKWRKQSLSWKNALG